VHVFPQKLFDILRDSDPTVIGWTEDGKAFTVADMAKFSETVLLHHFRHHNYPSFQRQLNIYGFRRVLGLDRTYAHEDFRRGEPDRLPSVRRFIPGNISKAPPGVPGKFGSMAKRQRQLEPPTAQSSSNPFFTVPTVNPAFFFGSAAQGLGKPTAHILPRMVAPSVSMQRHMVVPSLPSASPRPMAVPALHPNLEAPVHIDHLGGMSSMIPSVAAPPQCKFSIPDIPPSMPQAV
jgi:hypothetical protein